MACVILDIGPMTAQRLLTLRITATQSLRGPAPEQVTARIAPHPGGNCIPFSPSLSYPDICDGNCDWKNSLSVKNYANRLKVCLYFVSMGQMTDHGFKLN
jgi:hypothetical protein